MQPGTTATILCLLAFTASGQGMTRPLPPPAVMSEPETVAAAQNIVVVSGTASVAMVPDLVSMDLGVTTTGTSVRALVDENTTKVTKIISLLKAKGVRPDMIKTSRFSLSPVHRDGVRTGYEVETTIGVSSKIVSEVGVLVDAAIDSGANEIHGPEFGVENEKAVQDACISEAFKDAKAKATRLAALSERKLGRVLAVTDGSSSPFELRSTSGFSGGVEGGVLGGIGLEPGVHKVNCGVTVGFALE